MGLSLYRTILNKKKQLKLTIKNKKMILIQITISVAAIYIGAYLLTLKITKK